MKKKYIIETTKYIKKKTKKRILGGGKPPKTKSNKTKTKMTPAELHNQKMKINSTYRSKIYLKSLPKNKKSLQGVKNLRDKYANYQKKLKLKNSTPNTISKAKEELNQARKIVKTKLEEGNSYGTKINRSKLSAANKIRYNNLINRGSISYSNSLSPLNTGAKKIDKAKYYIKKGIAYVGNAAIKKYRSFRSNANNDLQARRNKREQKETMKFEKAKLNKFKTSKNIKNLKAKSKEYNQVIKNEMKGFINEKKKQRIETELRILRNKAQVELNKLLEDSNSKMLSNKEKVKALDLTKEGKNNKSKIDKIKSRLSKVKNYLKKGEYRMKQNRFISKVDNSIKIISNSPSLSVEQKTKRLQSLKKIVENAKKKKESHPET